MVLFLVPYYTHVLSTAEYGTADLISTTAFMLIPIFTISITEAVFRFSMDADVDPKSLFTNGIVVLLIGNAIFLVLTPLIGRIDGLGQYISLLAALIFTDSLYNMTAQFVRGKGDTKLYATAGFIQTASLVCFNLLFLLEFQLGVNGYVLSMILSYVTAWFFLAAIEHLYRYVGRLNGQLLKKMVKYSIPMIPSAFSWWAMASADKYVILAVIGAAANGIYLVAQKIPTVLNVFITIFQQAWQISAVEEHQNTDVKEFSEKIFKYLQMSMFLCASLLIVIVKPLYRVWVSSAYYSAWIYTPMLLLATVYSCLSKFMETNYLVTKKTMGNLKVTVTGCLVNLGLNIILIPLFGVIAAATTTFIGYLVTFLMTFSDARKESGIRIHPVVIIASTFILIVQGLVLSLPKSIWIPAEIGIFVMHSLLYRNEIKNLFKVEKNIPPKYSGGGTPQVISPILFHSVRLV